MSDLERFADRISRAEGALSALQYRVGYRFAATQNVLTQVEIPAEILERAVLSKMSVVPRVTPNGTVTADTDQSDLASENQLEVAAIPINELVNRAMAPDNLRVEEAKISDLCTLLDLLEQSVSKVKSALAIIPKRT